MNKIISLFYRFKKVISKIIVRNSVQFLNKKYGKTLKCGLNIKIYNPNVKIGKNVTIYDNVIIWGEGDVIIGDDVKIGFNVIIYAFKGTKIVIGNRASVAGNSYIINMNHVSEANKSLDLTKDSGQDLFIGNDVLVYSGCIVGKGAKINDFSVIAANSFVNSVIPSNCLAAGSPAQIKKYF